MAGWSNSLQPGRLTHCERNLFMSRSNPVLCVILKYFFFSLMSSPPAPHSPPIHSNPCCNAWWAGSILCMTPATSVGRCQFSLLIMFESFVVSPVTFKSSCYFKHIIHPAKLLTEVTVLLRQLQLELQNCKLMGGFYINWKFYCTAQYVFMKCISILFSS